MTVRLRSGENQEVLFKRFRKEVTISQILSIYRKKRWYVSKSELNRQAKQKAIRKAYHKTKQSNR